nr:hypothetical protein [Tanacetum cinerariifolium]
QADNARYWKIPACYDDDDDYNFAIIPNELVKSLSMGDEHLDTVLATESDEFIKSSVENLVPNPSEFEGEKECDVPACFATFSNILFDSDYDLYSSDDQLLSDEDLLKEIYSNPLFDEEIISIKIDPHHFNAYDLTLLKSILPGISKTDCYPEEETYFTKRLLYDNSSPRPLEEFVSENSDAEIESFSLSPIPIEDIDSFMEEIDLSFNPDDPMPPRIEEDDYDSEREFLIFEELLSMKFLSLLKNESFHFDIPSSSRPPAKPPDDSYRRILSFKSSFPQLQLGNHFVNELAHIISPPEYDRFYFKDFPDPGELMSVLNSRIRENLSTTPVNLPIEDDHSPLLAYVVWIFLAYLTYPVIPPYLHPFGNEDTIFDPGITINHFYSFKPGSSHRHGASKKFNTHRKIDLSFTLDDPMPPGIKEDDYDSERDVPILEELLDNYSLSLPENESFYFDILSSSRPPAKPPDGEIS